MIKTETEKLEYQRKQFIRRWWLVAKNQAKIRGQDWNLPWEVYYELWTKDDRWMHRGRASDELCMCRIDFDNLDWHPGNVQIITRKQMLRLESMHKRRNL